MDKFSTLFYIINHQNKRNDYYIAKYLLLHYDDIEGKSLEQLAEDTYVSLSTVKSFFRKYQLGSYHRFLEDYKYEVRCLQYRIEEGNNRIYARILPYIENKNVVVRGEYEELVQLIPYQKEWLLCGCLVELAFTNISNSIQDCTVKTVEYKDIHQDMIKYYLESAEDMSNVA